MGYQFEVVRPVPDAYKSDIYTAIGWRKKNAPFSDLVITEVARLLNSIGWDTEVGKIINDTGTLNEKQILWLMRQPGFKQYLTEEIQYVFAYAMAGGYDVKVIKPGDKAEMYREMVTSQDEAWRKTSATS